MRIKRGFTLIELVVAIAVLGILAALLVTNSASARLRSRDANRRESVSNYHTSFEQYTTAHGTYFVKSGTCVQTGTAQQSGRPVYIQAAGAGCTGIYGGGSGRITRRTGSANSNYSILSIADGLTKEGYLTRVYTDPLDSKLPYDAHSDHDFIVTICQANGEPALTPSTAKEFAIYASIEGTSTKEEATAKQLCGGTNTAGGGWEYWLADNSVSPLHTFADVPTGETSTATSSAGNQSAPAALTLPKVAIQSVDAAYSSTAHTVTGSFVVNNQDTSAVGSLYFTVALVADVAGGTQQQISDQTVTNLITLSSDQKSTITYSVPVDARINIGSYYVVIRGWTQTGLPFAAQSKNLKISDTQSLFLDFDTTKATLYRDAEIVPPLAAATYANAQKVIASLTVQNPHPINYVVVPRVRVYERAALPGINPVRTEKLDPVVVNGLSTQAISVTLPDLSKPESYLARVDLLDTQGNPISGFEELRWVIAGEGGKILTTKVQGSQYLTRTVLSADVTVVGPADNSEIPEAHLAMKVLDSSSKEVLYSDEISVSKLNGVPRNLTIPIEFKSGLRSLNSVIVEFSLLGTSDIILHQTSAQYTLNLSRFSPPYYLVVPIALLLILLVVYLYRRRGHSQHYMSPTALVSIVLLLVGMIASPLQVKAGAMVATDPTAVQVTDVANCTATPVQQGVPAQCSTIWTNNEYPQVQVIRSYDKTVLQVNDTVTLTVQFSLQPANNGTLTADLSAVHAVADIDPDCVDAINLSDANVASGFWVKSVVAASVGTTQIATTVHSLPSTQCWQGNSCLIDDTVQQTITCEAGDPNATPTPQGTPIPSPSFTAPTVHYIGNGSKLF